MKTRVNIILALIGLVTLILLSRLYYLSIKSNTYYEELSKQNYIKKIYEAPSRGLILDRNGEALAINNLGFSISIKPHLRYERHLPKLNELLDKIVQHFPEFEKEKLLKKYRKLDSYYSHEFVQIIDYIAYDKFFEKYAVFNSLENIKVEAAVKREYPFKGIASHVIGYVGKASRKDIDKNSMSKYSGIIGKNGLERYYNDKLQGTLGYKEVKVNALNKHIEVLNEVPPSRNNDLRTTIDIKLQSYVNEIFNHKAGAVIIMDAKNGELISSSSFPHFDNNIFVGGISHKDWNVLRNDVNHAFINKL